MGLGKRLSFVSAAVILALCLVSPRTALAGGPVGAPFVIGDQAVDTVYPAVAHSSIFDDYLVVWHRDHPSKADIYGQLVTPDGMLSGSRWAIAAGLGTAQRRYPDVTFNPNWNEYLVVWEQLDPNSGATSIRGRRVQSTGEPVGGEILISGPGPRSVRRPKVAHAFTSGTYLVVWENHTQGSVSNDIVGQVVGNDGVPVGANMTIAQGTWTASMELPDLAYNRTRNEFLVVWQQQDKATGRYDIYGRRATGGGMLLLPESIEIARYTVPSTAPAVAAIPKPVGQGRYLVAWELQYTHAYKHIMARVVHGDGSMLTPGFYVAAAPVDEFHPAVAGNEGEKRFLVSWTTADMSLFLCHARELTLQGEPASGDPVLAEVFADHSAVADGPLGGFLVVFDGQTLVGNLDIHGRLWGNRVYLPVLLR